MHWASLTTHETFKWQWLYANMKIFKKSNSIRKNPSYKFWQQTIGSLDSSKVKGQGWFHVKWNIIKADHIYAY